MVPEPRTPSALSTLSAQTKDSERIAFRKDALRIYQSEELPSVYQTYSDFDVPLGSIRGGAGGNVVDWDGDNDKARPINWPKWKKALNITCLFLMCVVS